MFIRILAGIAALVTAIVIGGVSGLTFYVWPTGLHDQKLAITPEVIQHLRSLKSEHKFGPDPAAFYPGAMHESERLIAQASVDSTIESLITELPARPQRSTVLRTIKHTLARPGTSESEERDQILSYLSKVMAVCGVNSSDELFNVWRYGFPYGWLM